MTTTGISAAIDATGEILAETRVHQRTGLAVTVSPRDEPLTLAVRFGEWLGPVALAVALGALLPLSRRRADATSLRGAARRR